METPSIYNWQYEDTKNRSPIWYVIALSVAVWLILWGFLTRQYGMSLVIMLVSGFFFFLENNSDENVRVDVSELGIKVQDHFYDYAKIWAFSIVYDGSNAIYLKLFLKKNRVWMVNLRIDNTIAADMRSILPNFIEEKEKQEITLSEKIIHLLKL